MDMTNSYMGISEEIDVWDELDDIDLDAIEHVHENYFI